MLVLRFAPVLGLMVVISLAGMSFAAAQTAKSLCAAFAGLFALTIAAVGATQIWTTLSPGVGGAPSLNALKLALRDATALSVLVYAWGSAAMFLIYKGSGLIWQHGWQYGTGLAVIALGQALYVWMLGQKGHWTGETTAINAGIRLAMAHGSACFAILCWMLATGKLMTVKDDWAANYVFFAITSAVAVLSAVAVWTHYALKAQPRPGHV
jgi:hypothetical protein